MTIFSGSNGAFNKVSNIVHQLKSLNIFKMTEIVQNIFSEQMELNYKIHKFKEI